MHFVSLHLYFQSVCDRFSRHITHAPMYPYQSKLCLPSFTLYQRKMLCIALDTVLYVFKYTTP